MARREKTDCHLAKITQPSEATGTEENSGSTKQQNQDTFKTPLRKAHVFRIFKKREKKANVEFQNSGSQNLKAY